MAKIDELLILQIHFQPLPAGSGSLASDAKDDGSYAPILIRLAWHSSGAATTEVFVGFLATIFA